MKKRFRQAMAVVVILVLLSCIGLGQPIVYALFGWLLFLLHNLPEVRFRPASFAQAVVAFGLLLWATHSFLGWLYRRRPQEDAPEEDSSEAKPSAPREWQFRWSAACVVSIVVMFAAGISMIALVHQVGWLVTSDQPLMSYRMEAGLRSQSVNNLKQLGIGAWNYHDAHGSFPPGGTFNRYGEMQHGWITHLLPFVERADLYEQVHWDLPWDHTENAEVFSTSIPNLLNPSLRDGSDYDGRGYALSGYAANVRVLGPNASLTFQDIPDGTSKTILAGEVEEDLHPWGSPTNWRDPAAGVRSGPGSFGGGRKNGGVQFLFVDGSVRHLSGDIDPSILKALATPGGGEPVDEDL